MAVIDLGPDFRLRDPADYPRWYGFEHPRPDLLATGRLRIARAASGRPGGAGRAGVSHRWFAGLLPDRYAAGARSAWPEPASWTTSSSTPRAAFPARVAKRSRKCCSGGQRERPRLRRGRPSPRRGDRAGAGRCRRGGRGEPVDFLPHLIPMTRGILSACHVRPAATGRARPSSTPSTTTPTRSSRFVQVVATPPATKHVTGSNSAASMSAATSAPAGCSPSASSTTSSRVPPGRPSRRSTSVRPAGDERSRAAAAGPVTLSGL